MTPKEIALAAARTLDAKKAADLEVIDISALTTLGDYLVIASGTSTTQVKALADEVEEKLSEQGIEPHHIEGRSTSWILLDYTSVMVHVFHTEARNFYALERMWADGIKLPMEELLPREASGEDA